MRVELSTQVYEFVRNQAPEPRRRLRRALRDLAKDKGDISDLQGPLKAYARLRIGSYRIIVARETDESGEPCIRCVFAQRRDTVYTVFSHMLQRDLLA